MAKSTQQGADAGRRSFNQSERMALSRLAGGKCAICGKELPPDWEADHVIPRSLGGPTDILNGQALCPECNNKKGSSMMPWLDSFFQETWGKSPRAFQTEAFRVHSIKASNRRVWSITPAGGKTMLGVACGKWHLDTGKSKRIVVVAPTVEVRDSWKSDFSAAGVNLAAEADKNVELESAYRGVVTTYASVCATPIYFKGVAGGNAYIIFDEIHHLEDQNGWGQKAKMAFDSPGNFILGLTGTLWRSRASESIPFLKYDADGFIEAEFKYGYDQALADGIVRSISFPTWDTMDDLTQYLKRGLLLEGSFDDSASQEQLSDTLRCATRPDLGFLPKMIEAAHQRLMSPQLRGGQDRKAGGIFFGDRIEGLDYIHRDVFKPLGIRAMVVHSGPDCDDPKGEIKRFRDDPQWEWIICAKMISEGVSIDRLRVGVHGCCTISELAFRQMIGRLLRRPNPDEVEAFYYMPRHPELVNHAKTIEQEKLRAREIAVETSGDKGGGGGTSTFVPLSAEGEASDHIVGSHSIENEYVLFSESITQKAGLQTVMSPSHAAKLLTAAGVAIDRSLVPQRSAPKEIPYEDAKIRKSKKIEGLVRQAAAFCLGPGEHSSEEKRDEIKRIKKEILTPLDGIWEKQRDVCSLSQLEARYEKMVLYIQELTRARR
jgi:superfamily II DNA or RNA helicase